MRARTLTVDSLASAEEAEWEERRLCLKEIDFIFSLPNLAGGSCNKGNKEKVRTMENKKNGYLSVNRTMENKKNGYLSAHHSPGNSSYNREQEKQEEQQLFNRQSFSRKGFVEGRTTTAL